MKPTQKQFEEGELLILADGKILAHNITREMAAVLSELDPENELMRQRATQFRPQACGLITADVRRTSPEMAGHRAHVAGAQSIALRVFKSRTERSNAPRSGDMDRRTDEDLVAADVRRRTDWKHLSQNPPPHVGGYRYQTGPKNK